MNRWHPLRMVRYMRLLLRTVEFETANAGFKALDANFVEN